MPSHPPTVHSPRLVPLLAPLVCWVLGGCGDQAADQPLADSSAAGAPGTERRAYPRPPPEDWPANSAAQDQPALALMPNADVWVSYQVFDGESEGVELSLLTDWGETVVPVRRGAGHLLGTAAAADGDGALHVVWSEQGDDRWVLNEVVFAPSAEPGTLGPAGPLTTLVEAPGERALHPMMTAGDDGSLLLVWMTLGESGSDIRAQAFRLALGWSPAIAVSDDGAGHWFPALCSRSGGRFAVVWDAAVQGDYDVLLAELSLTASGAPKVDARQRVTHTPRYEANASVAAAAERLYVAYEAGPENWGREGSLNKLTEALHDIRTVEVLAIDDGRIAPLAEPFMKGINKNLRKGCERPRIRIDGSGNLVLAFRGMPLPPDFQEPNHPAFIDFQKERGGGGVGWRVSIWFTYLSLYDGNTWEYAGSHHGGLNGSNGRSDAPFALGPLQKGGTAYAVVGDQRERGEPIETADGQELYGDNLVWWRPMTVEETLVAVGRVGKGQAAPELPLGETAALPAWRDGAANVAPALPRRTLADGSELICALGDLHRHTDLSRCSSNWDGPFTDAVRYAFDVGGLQFMAVTDHFEHMNGYDWWRNVGSMEAYHAPGRMVQMLSYERSDAFTGHRNVIARTETPPVIGYRGKYHPTRDDGVADYLDELWAQFEGHDVLTIPHTPAGMFEGNPCVFDWLAFEPRYDRLIEIFQGYRGASEVMGGPRSVPTTNQGRFARDALDGGLHFGFIASSDHQSSYGSFAGAWVPAVQRGEIFDALHSRLTFAATCRMTLWVEWDGVPMGVSTEAAPGPTGAVLVEVELEGERRLSRVELIVNGAVVRDEPLSGQRATVSLLAPELVVPATGSSYAYVRVRTADGELGWSSPTRLSGDGSVGPDGPSGAEAFDATAGPALELGRNFTEHWQGRNGAGEREGADADHGADHNHGADGHDG